MNLETHYITLLRHVIEDRDMMLPNRQLMLDCLLSVPVFAINAERDGAEPVYVAMLLIVTRAIDYYRVGLREERERTKMEEWIDGWRAANHPRDLKGWRTPTDATG